MSSVAYAKCLFCGMTKPVHSKKYPTGALVLGELVVPPSEFPVIQVRVAMAGPGRGHRATGTGGFPTALELSMGEALEDPAYGDLAKQMRDRLVEIVKSYIGAGYLDPQELIP